MSFKWQVIGAVFWAVVALVLGKSLSFLTLLILARLLTPKEFGLVTYALLAITSVEFLREMGFGSALIYRRDRTEEAADVAFIFIVIASLVLYGICFLGAPYVLLFFPDAGPDLIPVLRILALILVISSFGHVPFVLLAKELDFKKRTLPRVISGFVSSVVSILMAWRGFGVWSLVSGQLLDASLSNALVWLFCPWRPRLRFHKELALELFRYGRNLVASRVLIFLITNVDDVFVGRLLGKEPLGVYNFAYRISNLPATHITKVVSGVMFPAFSKVQCELEVLRTTFFKTTRYVCLLSVPVAVTIMAFASDFINIAYGGSGWEAAIVPIQLLGLYGLIRSIAANMGNVFKAGGKPQWLMYIALWRLSTMLVFLYPATRFYGIVGVSALSAVVAVVDFIISAVLTNRIVRASLWEYVHILGPILLFSLIAAGLAKAILLLFLPYRLLSLVVAGSLVVLFYLALTWALDKELREAIFTLMREIRLKEARI